MTPAAVGTVAPIIRIDRNELPSTALNALIGMRVTSGLRIPGRARLDFLDDGFSISAGHYFKLGSPVSITTADSTSLFVGEVTGVDLDIERGAPNVSVIADDISYRMTLGTRTKTYTQRSYTTIVEGLVGKYFNKSSITAVSETQEYVLQSDSDFAFITEIADRLGYDWWVDPQGVFQFHPMGSQSGSSPTVAWTGKDGGLQHFSVKASALHPQKVIVDGWDPNQQEAVTATSGTVGPQPSAEFVKPYLAASSLSEQSTITTAYHPVGKQQEAKALADSAATRSLASAVIATGVCRINPKIRVGQEIGVEGVGPASGSYPVTEVEHTYSLSGFNTSFTAGDRAPTSLADTLGAPTHSSFRKDALVVGVVTNLGDDSSPKGYIKVKFPTLGGKIESAWARVVSLGAGDSRGMTFLPEPGDEVIVGFEGGDVARPLVLGGLYSGVNAALEYGTDQGKVAKRQIVSRLGHIIELGDGNGEADQHIWLVLEGGQFAIKLGKDGLSATVPSGKPVKIAAGSAAIEMDSQENISVAGNAISIEAKTDVEIKAKNIKLKAENGVEASGLTFKASGTSSAELSAGGKTSVKGGTVMIN